MHTTAVAEWSHYVYTQHVSNDITATCFNTSPSTAPHGSPVSVCIRVWSSQSMHQVIKQRKLAYKLANFQCPRSLSNGRQLCTALYKTTFISRDYTVLLPGTTSCQYHTSTRNSSSYSGHILRSRGTAPRLNFGQIVWERAWVAERFTRLSKFISRLEWQRRPLVRTCRTLAQVINKYY